ncbi:MAG: PRD domain-containing protein, partial [Thomasclavelia ramosa]
MKQKYYIKKNIKLVYGQSDYIEEKTGIRLDDDEAGYIALHLVNFSLDNKANNATKIVTLTKEVLNVIKLSMKVDLEEDSS